MKYCQQKWAGWTTLIRGQLYLEHATEYGPLLNLKVAQKKTSAGPVPMVKPLLPATMMATNGVVGRLPFLSARSISQDFNSGFK